MSEDADVDYMMVLQGQVQSLTSRLEAAERTSLENNMLAYGWMKMHDALLGFIQNRPDVLRDLIENDPRPASPKPTDVPECVARLEAAERERDEARAAFELLREALLAANNVYRDQTARIASLTAELEEARAHFETLHATTKVEERKAAERIARLTAEVERLKTMVTDARKAALEEAAKVADEEAERQGVNEGPPAMNACSAVADTIRALTPAPSKEGE